MTRGHPPHVAIGEAGRKAKALGWLVLVLEPAGELPFHFVTCDRGCVSLVRVRRLKYPGFTVEEIEHSCREDIAALRSVTITEEIFRELWVRGPDRHWYRFLVLPDSLVVIENEDEPDINSPDGEPWSVRADGIRPDRKKPEGIELDDHEPDIIKPDDDEPDIITQKNNGPDIIEMKNAESARNESPERVFVPTLPGIISVNR